MLESQQGSGKANEYYQEWKNFLEKFGYDTYPPKLRDDPVKYDQGESLFSNEVLDNIQDDLIDLDDTDTLISTDTLKKLCVDIDPGIATPHVVTYGENDISKADLQNKDYTFVPQKKGEIFTEHNLMALRSDKGISVSKWFKFIGRKSKKDYKKYQMISE